MTPQNDLEYYRRREVQCRSLAEKATDPGIRHAHTEMATIYARKTAELERMAAVRV